MMSSVEKKTERPNDELTTIQHQISRTTNESLESTRRMVDLAAQSHETGINTITMLSEQGEKLDQTEPGLDKIDVEMTQAEKNLTNLKECCGLCILPCECVRRRTETYKSSSTTNPNKSPSTVTTTEPKSRAKNDGSTTASNNYIDRSTKDDRETETNTNLETVGNYVGQLKNMAFDMNKTIEGQNIQISNITPETEYESGRITAADKEAKNILRNA